MRRKWGRSAIAEDVGSVDRVAQSAVHAYLPLEFVVRAEIVARSRHGLFGHRGGLDLMGWVHLPELKLDLVFRSSDRSKASSRDPWATATVVPAGFRLPVPAQEIDDARLEGRDLWFMTSEPQRRPPWLEHYAGRCDQKIPTFARPLPAKAALDVSSRVMSSPRGDETRVDIWGDLRFERPLSMKAIFRDSEGPEVAEAEKEIREMPLIPTGSRVPMERQSLTFAAAAQPWIGIRVSDGEGHALFAEHALVSRTGFE